MTNFTELEQSYGFNMFENYVKMTKLNLDVTELVGPWQTNYRFAPDLERKSSSLTDEEELQQVSL